MKDTLGGFLEHYGGRREISVADVMQTHGVSYREALCLMDEYERAQIVSKELCGTARKVNLALTEPRELSDTEVVTITAGLTDNEYELLDEMFAPPSLRVGCELSGKRASVADALCEKGVLALFDGLYYLRLSSDSLEAVLDCDAECPLNIDIDERIATLEKWIESCRAALGDE